MLRARLGIPKLAHRRSRSVLWHRGRTPRSHWRIQFHALWVELDANRAESAKANGIQTIQGNVFDVRARVERFSFLYLNPPYDFEVGPRSNERMEKLFLGHTYAWLKPKGVLLMVIPCKAVFDVSDTLSTRFKDIAIYRLVGEESEKYDQCAIFGIRHNNNGHETILLRQSISRMMYYPSSYQCSRQKQIGCIAFRPAATSRSTTSDYRSMRSRIVSSPVMLGRPQCRSCFRSRKLLAEVQSLPFMVAMLVCWQQPAC